MKLLDNSPLESSCIGQLIEEKCSVGQLVDNCIYIIADKNSQLAKSAVKAMEELKSSVDDDEWFHPYELEVIDEIELKNHPKIKERLDEHGDNTIFQLYTPYDDNKKFIVAKTTENDIFENIGLIIYTAERFAQSTIIKALKAYAIGNPDEFEDILKDNTPKDDSSYIDNICEALPMECMFDMVAPVYSSEDFRDKEGKSLTYKEQNDIINSLSEIVKSHRKRPTKEIDAALDSLFSSVDPVSLKIFFLKLSPQMQEKMLNNLNPNALAKNSNMDVKVIHIGVIDGSKTTRGKYRLFFEKNYDRIEVPFTRRPAFILYLIYLIDKKINGSNVDTLKLEKYRSLFGKLFELTYGYNGEKEFDKIMSNINEKGNVKQRELNVVMLAMRNAVGSACERMCEPAEPFIVKDVSSHLAVLPEHIFIPNELITLV